MHFEIAWVRVALSTLVTYVLFASSVDVAFVCAEVTALTEAFPTELTAVWLLTCVSALVQLQTVGVVEALAAVATAERFQVRMRAAVRHKAALLTEALATLFAGERLLPGVNALMDLEVHRVAECLPAQVAGVWP